MAWWTWWRRPAQRIDPVWTAEAVVTLERAGRLMRRKLPRGTDVVAMLFVEGGGFDGSFLWSLRAAAMPKPRCRGCGRTEPCLWVRLGGTPVPWDRVNPVEWLEAGAPKPRCQLRV